MPVDLSQVLIVEDDTAHIEAIARAFARISPDTRILRAGSLAEYRQAIALDSPDIVLMDLNLPDGRATEALSNGRVDQPLMPSQKEKV